MNDEKEFYSVYEMAKQINVTAPTIYRWMDKDGLKFEWRNNGKGIRVRKTITMDDMRDFLASIEHTQQV